MGKLAKHDEEDDEARDPGVALVGVHDPVAEKGHNEGGHGNNHDPGPARHARIHGIKELRTDNHVDGRPSDAGKDVENSN